MDAVAFATYMYKLLNQREQEIASALGMDAAKDWEHYKLMVGEIRGISYAREEIKALLENHADDVEDLISS
jgi:hypothetical protein|tara:strand:+ start:654 stop:866 length:213 start_codon:yes stop_codon:yes gene_type:complete